MGVEFSRLSGSRLSQLAVDVFRRHAPDVSGQCLICHTGRCAARRHAHAVLHALGLDPALYDRPASAVLMMGGGR